jgi:hypothetical protein
MNDIDQIGEVFSKHRIHCGRMISSNKTSPKGHLCVWNANIVSKSSGKIWFGDLNITKEGNVLKEIAKEIGETLYILHEKDCRFDTENDPIDLLISRSVWNTEMDIPHER